MLDRPATPAGTLQQAAAIGRDAGLQHVYLGNLPIGGGEDTCCPHCQATVIRRRGVQLLGRALDHGRCRACGRVIAGIGLE
jgi:pyruvate formate lyase activating enzyme